MGAKATAAPAWAPRPLAAALLAALLVAWVHTAAALDAAEAAELQALCDLNPQATRRAHGKARAICDALSGGLDPCGVGDVACSADGHLTNL